MENLFDPAVPASGWEDARSLTVVYLGNILAQDFEVELTLNAHRRGLAMEVSGGIFQRQPQTGEFPLIPVALQLPDILAAQFAVPAPFQGTLHVRLELNGFNVLGRGEIALTLPTSPQPIQLFRFRGLFSSLR